MEKALERLSTGFRINKAADDAAGMAISTKMKTQIAALEQASRNSADAVSVIQTAEGALNEVQSMLQRMRELSVQAANGTLNSDDRAAIQSEVDQLKEEIDRISSTTEFNTKSLLDGTLDRKTLSSNKAVDVLYISDEVEPQDYVVDVKNPATKTTVTGQGTVQAGNCPGGAFCINGETVTIPAGVTLDTAFDSIHKLCDTMGVTLTSTSGAIQAGKTLVFTNDRYGASYNIDFGKSSQDMLS